MSFRVITIDGPAGAGKTTVSKQLAAELGCVYVDTGALYRGVAYEIDRQGIDWKDDGALSPFLDALDLNLIMDGRDLTLTSSGRYITSFLRTPEITMLASATSANPLVRRALLGIQKSIAATRDAVFEGRDMGTAVFPRAQFKFFLFADLEIRLSLSHVVPRHLVQERLLRLSRQRRLHVDGRELRHHDGQHRCELLSDRHRVRSVVRPGEDQNRRVEVVLDEQ